MKKRRKEESFLEQLRLIPNVSLACEKVGIARNSVYRWRGEDKRFKLRMDHALGMGVESISDLSESKIIQSIKSGNLTSAKYWLDNHKKNYIRPRPKSIIEKALDKEIPNGYEFHLIRSKEHLEAFEALKKKREEEKRLNDPEATGLDV